MEQIKDVILSGVTLDENLSWKQHTAKEKKERKKVSKSIGGTQSSRHKEDSPPASSPPSQSQHRQFTT